MHSSGDQPSGDGTFPSGPDDLGTPAGVVPGSVAQALRMTVTGLDFLNSPAAGDLDGAACGEVLLALAAAQAKLTAAQASFLRRFDAADAHSADAYGTSAAWLAGRAKMTRRAAKAAVRRMRLLVPRPHLHDALAQDVLSDSQALAVEEWTRRLPEDMRQETDKVIVAAAEAGASFDDLATIAGLAIERWRQQRPDGDGDGRGLRDRWLSLATTFGGAGLIRGDLTPECAAGVSAVLEALGKRRGPEDDRSRAQRWHDALQEACQLLIRARMVPDRAGADTQVTVHIGLSQLRDLPGATELEEAWLRARLGEPGYLEGTDAQAAACDAMTVPVVTGHADMTVIDKIIALVLAAAGHHGRDPLATLSPQARQAHRHAIARLALDFVSGPGGLASALRTGLLGPPYDTPSLPLDIGASATIPAHIRRAVALRDQHCAWPGGCDRPASASDVHHLRHQRDGGETSLENCTLLCNYHHDICIHRWGWQLTRHPDGTMQARSPDGTQVIKSHALPP